MRYIFPPTKFVRENTPTKQISHVFGEFEEFKHTHPQFNAQQHYQEAVDLYHSLETLFHIWEATGVDMEAVMQKVLDKNRERGYYTPVTAK